MRSRDEMLHVILVILDHLDGHEHTSEQGGAEQQPHECAALSELRRADRRCHEQTADEEDSGVCSAEHDIQAAARFHENVTVRESVNGVAKKQSTKQKHFSRKKDPDPEPGGITL